MLSKSTGIRLDIFTLTPLINNLQEGLKFTFMKNQKEDLDTILIKLNILESRIQKLKSITNEVLAEVNDKFHTEIDELYAKKEEAEQILLKLRQLDDLE